MPRITPVHWKILECVFKKDGFVFERQSASHRIYVKEGVHRPIVIPTYSAIDKVIITGSMKTAGMSRKTYFELLEECK